MKVFVMLFFLFIFNVTDAFAYQCKPQWFFLMAGASGGIRTSVYVVVGPFTNAKDCIDMRAWVMGQDYSNKTSQCWETIN